MRAYFGQLPAAKIAIIGSVLMAVASPVDAQAPKGEEAPATMLVFDGSGSMWARLDGDKQPKFYLVRDALKAAIAKAPAESRMGMAAFGHRRQGDCTDVQVQMPPEEQSGGEKLQTLIDKHNPRGKSPLAQALREAVKALPKGSGPRSLLIVHDDLDNCGQDPCAVLQELRAAQPNLVVHALGLGLKGEDAQRLQCLVRPTGGKLVDVQAGTAIGAAAEELVKLASLSTQAKPAPPVAQPKAAPQASPAAAAAAAAAVQPAPKQSTPSRAVLRKDGPSALRLATVLQTGVPPTPRDVHWVVRPAEQGSTLAPISAVGQDAAVALPPGPYVVEVRDGVTQPKPIPVVVAAQGETGLDVPLDAGLLRATFASVPQLARIQLISGETGTPAAILPADRLATGIAVPQGRWLVRLVEGTASKDVPIDMKAGAVSDLGVQWPFGSVVLTIAGEVASSRFPATLIVYEDDPEAPRGRREVHRAAGGSGPLTLPAGAYTIVARQGSVESRDRVAVQGGETVQRTLSLAIARIALSSRLPGATAPIAGAAPEPVAYRLERLDVVPPEVFTANRQVAELDLPAGRYRIEARYGLVNARISQEVVLTAGQVSTVSLDQRAGTIRFTGPAGAVGDLLWEILDETGHPLWSTAQASPVAILQAGRYTVRLDHRGKRIERRIEVRVGDNRLIEVKD